MSTPQIFIFPVASATPPFQVKQTDAIDWLTAALEHSAPADGSQRAVALYRAMANRSTIASRSSWLEDFTHRQWDRMRIFDWLERSSREPQHAESATSCPGGRDLGNRMRFFNDATTGAIASLFADTDSPPQRLIQVSCTGYYAPSGSQLLCLNRGWLSNVQLLHIGHMGCYACLPATHMAVELAHANAAAHRQLPTSLVFTELCSLHLRPESTAPDQVVINSLFADGIIRVDVGSSEIPGSFRMVGYQEILIPGTTELMTWYPANGQFAMTLSGSVPGTIQSKIKGLVDAMLSTHDLTLADIHRFAIHPGGRRIIEGVGTALGAAPHQIEHSLAVFRERGNMSSATLPHVWLKLSRDERVVSGEKIVSMAFGPGLTVAMAIMEKV